jgi:hypothetical protein
MSAASSRALALSASAPAEASVFLKEDRPRRIDRVISFFGDSSSDEEREEADAVGDGWFE